MGLCSWRSSLPGSMVPVAGLLLNMGEELEVLEEVRVEFESVEVPFV